jgi:hypothetical protein
VQRIANKGKSEKGKVKKVERRKTSGSLPTACRDSGEVRRGRDSFEF